MPPLHLVMAPRTRLAASLLARTDPGRDLAIVVRHDGDEQWAAETYPGIARVRTDAARPLAAAYDDVVVHACALGAMTPVPTSTLADDSAALVRDIDFIGRVVDHGSPSVHVVFVSTVLALSPRRERQYYAGWKCIAEYELVRRFRANPAVRVSVVYPGRITEERSLRAPKSMIYTPYDALAARLDRLGREGGEFRQVVGADARAWLAVRGIRTMSSAFMPQKLPDATFDDAVSPAALLR